MNPSVDAFKRRLMVAGVVPPRKPSRTSLKRLRERCERAYHAYMVEDTPATRARYIALSVKYEEHLDDFLGGR